jgi:hypothetical protein
MIFGELFWGVIFEYAFLLTAALLECEAENLE